MSSMKSIIMTFILAAIIFIGLFSFYAHEVTTYSANPISGSMNATFGNMTQQLNEINATMAQVKEKTLALSESKTGGLTGLVVTTIEGFSATIKLMSQSLTFGFNSVMILIFGSNLPIPGWAITGVFLALTIVIIFAVLRAISGRIPEI